jgi:uncharacterized membrane protein
MSQWGEKAADLQRSTIFAELHQDNEFSESQVRRSIVHTRQDMILLVSHLSSVNEQLYSIARCLASIRFILILIAVLLIISGYRAMGGYLP